MTFKKPFLSSLRPENRIKKKPKQTKQSEKPKPERRNEKRIFPNSSFKNKGKDERLRRARGWERCVGLRGCGALNAAPAELCTCPVGAGPPRSPRAAAFPLRRLSVSPNNPRSRSPAAGPARPPPPSSLVKRQKVIRLGEHTARGRHLLLLHFITAFLQAI